MSLGDIILTYHTKVCYNRKLVATHVWYWYGIRNIIYLSKFDLEDL